MTDKSLLIRELKSRFPSLVILENEPLSRHCSFRIGGAVPAFIRPRDAEQLAALCRFLSKKGEKPFLMGNGTNLLFPDVGMDKIVIQTCPEFGAVLVRENTIVADSGALLSRVASAALSAGLTGLAFAHGIPGTVGGGVLMNAGAYGGELAQVVTSTDYLDESFELRTLRDDEHGFSYRHSFFSDKDCVILRSVFTLRPGDPEVIAAEMRALAEKRRASQPLDMPSAGSTFKRPAGGFAAALIDEAGLKGYAVGGAMVSPKHAGFVVNTGGATQEDVLRLIQHIRTVVFARSGIELSPEVLIIEG